MTQSERRDLQELLDETIRLRDRYLVAHPDSQRTPILIKDALRLARLLETA
jgi:hypothetical protein